MAPPKTRGLLRLVSVAVLVVLTCSTLALAAVVRSIVRDQERRLLRERASEAALLVTTLLGSPRVTLPVLAATTRPSEGSTTAFVTVAETLRGPGAIGALRVAGGQATVLGVAGSGPEPGASVDDDRAAVAVRATSEDEMTTGVVDSPTGRQLMFAVAVGEGLVAYQDLPLDVFADFRSDRDDPFGELEGVLYASSGEDPTKVVVATTRDLPLTEGVVRQKVDFGADTWLLVARSKEPLVGSFASKAPWAVLGAGLFAALLTTVLVETLSRRRAYALALVEERTTELRQAREAADTANQSKSEFLSRMSHELRTPLNAVLGFGQLLQLDNLTESQKEAVEQIVKGGRHLLDLINEILDISRIESGSLSLSLEPVLVDDLVDDTLTLLRPLADERGVRFSNARGVEQSVHVVADRQRLKQILLNIVANAVKYNRRGGTVTVSCSIPDDHWLRISVADDGPGIRSDRMDRLFTPFERLGAEASEVEGAGVGLALSRRLAEAMNGSIEVESVHGEGSCFSVRLPLAESPVEAFDRTRGASERPDASNDPAPRHTILYIEDNLSNVRLVERIVERRGDVDVIPAMQGGLGLTLAREHRPDVVLLDLHLPDMGGDEVLRRLREDDVTATIPVVVISADATARQIDRLLADGASAYLTKPLDVHAFLTLLASTIGDPSEASTQG